MDRRELLSVLLVASVPIAGCVRMDTQPDQVPIRVTNRTEERHDVGIECVERGGGEPLVSTVLSLSAGQEESVYAEPIRADGEYDVSVEVEDNTEETSISGGGLRNIAVEIEAVDRIRIERVDT